MALEMGPAGVFSPSITEVEGGLEGSMRKGGVFSPGHAFHWKFDGMIYPHYLPRFDTPSQVVV